MARKSDVMARSFPALASLGLSREHIEALALQGKLRAEDSSQGKYYYKLRFRVGSRQLVRYVGNNPQFIDQVQRELTRLQTRARSCRYLHRLIREANKCLRRTKHQLKLLLPLTGRVFHGREIRRRLECKDACTDCNETPQ